jgi:hypothetical protein
MNRRSAKSKILSVAKGREVKTSGVNEMRMSFVCGLVICFLATFFNGCSTIPSTAVVPRTAQDSTTSCYVFGRFLQTDPSPWYLKNILGNEMGVVLVLREVKSGASYQIRFQKSEPVVAIVVEPGTYSVAEIVFARRTRILERRLVTPGILNAEIVISTGQGCYIGDWLAHASSQTYGVGGVVGGGPLGPATYVGGPIRDEEQWDLKLVQNNYAQTTKEFLLAYPGLQGLRTFSAMQ